MKIDLATPKRHRYRSIVDKLNVLLLLEGSPAYDRRQRKNVYAAGKHQNSPSAHWREKFVGWSYKIVDLCQFYFSRETVDIAISFLDEYLRKKGPDFLDTTASGTGVSASSVSESMRKNLKLLIVASACIFLAIKQHESDHRFDIPTLVQLINGNFTRQDIVEAEKDILVTLDFRLSPPTIMSFIRIYLSFLDGFAIEGKNPITEKSMLHVSGLAKFLSELSIYDYFFVDKEASKVALACVLTAFEGISRDAFPQEYRQRVVDCVYREGKLDCTDQGVYECRIKLRGIFEARPRPAGFRSGRISRGGPLGSMEGSMHRHQYQQRDHPEDQQQQDPQPDSPSHPQPPPQEPQQQQQQDPQPASSFHPQPPPQEPQNEDIDSSDGDRSLVISGTNPETSHQERPSAAIKIARPAFPARQDSLRSVTSSASNNSNVVFPAPVQTEQIFTNLKNDQEETESTAESQIGVIKNTFKRRHPERKSSSPPNKKKKSAPHL